MLFSAPLSTYVACSLSYWYQVVVAPFEAYPGEVHPDRGEASIGYHGKLARNRGEGVNVDLAGECGGGRVSKKTACKP